jgi:flagellar hook-associated protein 1
MSSFFGFTIGVRALGASQKALEVIGHNIANINTRGHSRQEAVLATSRPEGMPGINSSTSAGQLGSGVEISEIRRLHDGYIENQLISEMQNAGKWDRGLQIFEQIETVFAEPSENGLRAMMDVYWNSWRDLEASPEDLSARKNLIENSESMCNLFKSIHSRLQLLQSDIDTEIVTQTGAINNYAKQITELNKLIKQVAIAGDNPNDLMDRRDVIIKDLSHMINVDVRQSDFDQVNIFIGGTALVREEDFYQLESVLNPASGFHDIKWEGSGRNADITSGQLYSLINFRDDYIPEVIDRLDQMASALITETNAIHSAGYGLDGVSTGYDFFSGSGIEDIGIEDQIADDTVLIAAASNPGQPGDNSNVLQISGIRDSLVLGGGVSTVDDYYNSLIVKIGIEAQQCLREQENTHLLINKINMRRESISGVSLDEELVNMVKYQHSYNAAARVIKVMDELFETVINELG